MAIDFLQRFRIKALVRGAYDIQQLRIAMGNRFVVNFKIKLGQDPGKKEDTLDPEVQALLDEIRAHNKLIADAVASGKLTPEKARKKDKLSGKVTDKLWKASKKIYKEMTKEGIPKPGEFQGNPVISDYTELALMTQYMELVRIESQHFKFVKVEIEKHPLFTTWLVDVRGIDRAMTGVLLSEIKIENCYTVSKLWAYVGYDVTFNKTTGRWEGRGKKKEHLVKRPYINREGKKEMRDSITFNPFLKTKLYVLADCFIKLHSEYRIFYDNYKHRMEAHAVYGERNDAASNKGKTEVKTSAGRRHNMAVRYMMKMFLKDVYVKWREIEGLPTRESWAEDKAKLYHNGVPFHDKIGKQPPPPVEDEADPHFPEVDDVGWQEEDGSSEL